MYLFVILKNVTLDVNYVKYCIFFCLKLKVLVIRNVFYEIIF